MKTVQFAPINESRAIRTEASLLDALLAHQLDVPMVCGGNGLCATCLVHVRDGQGQLTPPTERERRTLSYITGARHDSRLACQCRVLGEGVVVELPEGMFIERIEDVLDLVGTRAPTNILHPISGAILIEQGKLITRTRLEQFRGLQGQVEELRRSATSDR